MGILRTNLKNFVKHPLFAGSFLMMGGSMAINSLSYLYHLIIGRLLGPAEYGVLASVFSILYIASIVPLSSSIAIVKFIAASKNQKEVDRTYKGIKEFVFKVAIIFSVIMLAISLPISNFLHIKNPISIILLSPIVFFSLVTLVNQSTSQGLLKFGPVIISNFIINFAKLFFGIIFVIGGLFVPGAMLGILFAFVFAYIYSLSTIKRSIANYSGTGKFNLKPFLKYALPVLFQALAFTSLFTIDIILVKHFLPEFEAGLYASLSTSGKIIYFAATPIASVMFPMVTKRHAVNKSYRRVFVLTLIATAMVAIGVDLIYYFFPQVAITALFGSKYLSASGSLILMGIFMTFYSLNYFLVNYYLAIGKVRIVIAPIIAAISQIVLIFIWHSSIVQILKISIFTMLSLFVLLSSIIGYEKLKFSFARK